MDAKELANELVTAHDNLIEDQGDALPDAIKEVVERARKLLVVPERAGTGEPPLQTVFREGVEMPDGSFHFDGEPVPDPAPAPEQCPDVWVGRQCIRTAGHSGMHRCEGKQWDNPAPAEGTQLDDIRLEDLTMLLRRSVVRLRHHFDDTKGQTLADQIMEYLRKHEIAGGILRSRDDWRKLSVTAIAAENSSVAEYITSLESRLAQPGGGEDRQ